MTLFASLAFRGTFPPWAAVLLLLLGGAGMVFLYLKESKRLSLVTRMLLAAIRVALLASVLFLILRPTWVSETSGQRPRPIGLMFDVSQSMAFEDPRPNLADQYRAGIAFGTLKAPIPEQFVSDAIPRGTPEKPSRLATAVAAFKNGQLAILKTLQAAGPVEAIAFGSSREGLNLKTDWLNLKADKPRTAIADVASEFLNRDENERPGAIFIVTDGRENSSNRSLTDLARECATQGVPLHIYGVGSGSFSQLQVRDVSSADTLFVDDTAVVPVRFRSKGLLGKGKIEFKLMLNGIEVATETVDAPEGDDNRTLLKFVPKKTDADTTGKQDLTVQARYLGDQAEAIVDSFKKNVKIVDKKLKVLFVESQPRWDFKFIQRGLMRDRRCEAKFILLDGDPKAMKAGDPFLPAFPSTRAELATYDLIILGDIPATYFTAEQQEWIRDAVAEGGGLIQIAGKANGPSSFVGTPLADVLPVEVANRTFKMDPNARTDGFRPTRSSFGERSNLMVMDDDPKESARVWDNLPPMYWYYPVVKLKPAAEVYLTHPTDKLADGKPMPLLVSHYYGKGYVLFSAVDETWRWRRNEADKYFFRFWSQAVYATGVSRTLGTKMTQLSLDTTDPLLGKTGQIYAHLLNNDLKPVKAEKIGATIEKIDANAADPDRITKVTLNTLPNQAGEFVATVPFDREGRYLLKVDNGEDTATLEYRVSLPPNHEQAIGPLAEDDLRNLATQSGGQFYREEDLHTLGEKLEKKTVEFHRKEEFVLWNRWMLMLVIALLATEWTIRKFNSLS